MKKKVKRFYLFNSHFCSPSVTPSFLNNVHNYILFENLFLKIYENAALYIFSV